MSLTFKVHSKADVYYRQSGNHLSLKFSFTISPQGTITVTYTIEDAQVTFDNNQTSLVHQIPVIHSSGKVNDNFILINNGNADKTVTVKIRSEGGNSYDEDWVIVIVALSNRTPLHNILSREIKKFKGSPKKKNS